MIETFNDNLEQVEVEFVNSKGEKKVRKAKYLTIKDLRKLDEIRNDKEDPEQDIFGVLCKQMSFIFGGKKEEYEEYSFPMLRRIMDHIKDVFIINPLNHAQK